MAQFGKELWKLVSNRTALTVVGTAFAAWGALHFVGVGQVVDALLVSTLAAAVGALKVIAGVAHHNNDWYCSVDRSHYRSID